MIVKLFDQEFSAHRIAETVDLSYPTCLKALEIIRLSIISNSIDSEQWLDLAYFNPNRKLQGKESNQTLTVFGIMECDDKIKIDYLECFSLESVLKRNPRMLRKSSIYYTEAYRHYSFLLFFDHDIVQDRYRWAGINHSHQTNKKSKFWRYAKRIIFNYRGISRNKFPQYIKEIEFRYNNRNKPIFNIICSYLVSFIPTK